MSTPKTSFAFGLWVKRNKRIYGGWLWTGIDFLEFRASEIGAAVALSVSGEQLHTLQFDKFSFSSFCPHLDKVKKSSLLY